MLNINIMNNNIHIIYFHKIRYINILIDIIYKFLLFIINIL